MHFEAQIKLERTDRETLLADLAAVEHLLTQRRHARKSQSAKSAVRAAEAILKPEAA